MRGIIRWILWRLGAVASIIKTGTQKARFTGTEGQAIRLTMTVTQKIRTTGEQEQDV